MVYRYRVKAIKAIDGDTLDVIIDVGFHITVTHRVRLLGINCPEMNTPAGKAAKAFTEDWLRERNVDLLSLQTVKDRTEKYGRYLADIIDHNGQNLVQALLDMQHAVKASY